MRMTNTKRSFAAAGLMLAVASGPVAAGSAAEATLGAAAAASGRYFGAALDPDDFDEKPYRDLATRHGQCLKLIPLPEENLG